MRRHAAHLGQLSTHADRFDFGRSADAASGVCPRFRQFPLRQRAPRVFSARARAAGSFLTIGELPQRRGQRSCRAFRGLLSQCAPNAVIGSEFSGDLPEPVRKLMKNVICVALIVCAAARLSAQTATESPPAVSTPASSAEVQALRDEVRSLKELVQTLQQQVKAQQPATENTETPAEASASPVPSASAPPLFPTTDTAVVSSSSSPPVNANGTTTFPTADESVTTTPATVSTSDTGSSLTQPISVLGGGSNKNYMNISF